MQSEDRPIHFATELLHRPIQRDVARLQKLYFELSQRGSAGYDSTDFSHPVQSRFHSKRGTKSQSLALFLPDRLVLIEEWTDIPLASFLEKVRVVALNAMEALEIPQFVAQTATVRSTFALTHFDDTRVFLLDNACAQSNRIGPHFQRPVSVGGLRFVLPETPDHPGMLHVTIESFRQSVKEVFVEVKGVFGNQQLTTEDLDAAVENVRTVRHFITDNVFPYLDQFDTPREELL